MGAPPATQQAGSELSTAAVGVTRGSRFFMEVHQQAVDRILAGAGAQGPGGIEEPLGLLGESQEVIEAVLQDVGVYSAVTHSQSAFATFKTTTWLPLMSSPKWLQKGEQQDQNQLSVTIGTPPFGGGNPALFQLASPIVIGMILAFRI